MSEPQDTQPRAEDAITLRGHQLLCVLGFRGYGYSPTFVEHMTAVVARLRRDDATVVRVTSAPADLCAACPHLGPDGCIHTPGSEERVHQRDLTVMARLDIGAGDALPWGTIKERIAATIRPQDLQEICRGCTWLPHGYCAQDLDELVANWTARRQRGP